MSCNLSVEPDTCLLDLGKVSKQTRDCLSCGGIWRITQINRASWNQWMVCLGRRDGESHTTEFSWQRIKFMFIALEQPEPLLNRGGAKPTRTQTTKVLHSIGEIIPQRKTWVMLANGYGWRWMSEFSSRGVWKSISVGPFAFKWHKTNKQTEKQIK